MSLPAAAGAIDLTGALVAGDGSTVQAGRVRLRESELRGVVLEPGNVPGLTLGDVIMHDCGLSNVDAREGRLARVEVHRSQLVGFGLSRGDIRDLRVVDSSLQLASFASATLRNVVFERVNLTEASFMHARLEAVAFVDCRLEGADFRRRQGGGLRDPRRLPRRRARRRVPAWPADALARRPRLGGRPGRRAGDRRRVRPDGARGRRSAAKGRNRAPTIARRPSSSWIGASRPSFPSRRRAKPVGAGYTRPPRGCSSVG